MSDRNIHGNDGDMRKIGAIFGITALAAVGFFPLPATAFSVHLGPYYFRVPIVGHHYHHHQRHSGGNYSTTTRGAGETEQTNREARPETNTGALEGCTGVALGVTNLPIDQIRQTVHPTADQEAAIDDLGAASSQAADLIKSSCPGAVPLTPIGRLDVAEQRLDATIKAVQIVRSSLLRFDKALSDEQRRQFDAISAASMRGRSGGNMVTQCSQRAGSFIDLPVQRLEEMLEPTPEQQSAFDDLRKTTQRAADQLRSSCPTAEPQSPVARLDTVEAQLKAIADAMKAVRPALDNFYASLNDEQKARFNIMGSRAGPS